MKPSRELWLEVEPLLSAALEMERGARTAWLEGLGATRPEAMALLRRLVESHERAERSRELETLAQSDPPPALPSVHAPGMRIGPFELVRPIGRGGMGEVWLARQADGRVERVAALKLPALMHGDLFRERFRRERDILARLEHPHIARFYDAGVADSGRPWLAMEFVQGLSLTGHLESVPHSIPQRLALFRQVLAAVAHAHRHLVVHRDLKPANVLVDASGTVKLLDFGIAKLVDDAERGDAGADLTRQGGRVMTPRYAAPEQACGEEISTATDIYSLGVMLHEVLTGLSPYRAVREGKPLTDLALMREHPGVARGLGGDLEAILLKAMRRDPAERYASVELLDEDIVAYLEKRPVKARAGTWRYLAGRFAARHRLPLAMTAAILVTLIAGLVIAERERRVAVAESARAERHLANVRKLANAFIYDVHGKIESLPGSLAARELLIATALEYLDALASEPGRDPAILFEAASAYRAIASIQGNPRGANRGNLVASIGNFEKARGLLVELERLKPGDVGALREHARTSTALAYAYFQVTDPRWKDEYRRAVVLAERIAALPGAGLEDRALAAYARAREVHLANIATGRTAANEAVMLGQIGSLEKLQREAPAESRIRELLVTLYGNAGVMFSGPGEGPVRIPEALDYFERALALARELRAEAPGDMRRYELERVAILQLARRLAAEGELGRADALLAQAAASVQEQVARYPDDVTMAVSRLEILVGAADVANRLGDRARAMKLSREVLASAAALPRETSRLRDSRMQAAEAKVILGYALLGTVEAGLPDGRPRLPLLLEAQSLFGDVSAFLEEVRAEPSLGAVPEYKLREFANARARLEKALAAARAS